MRKININKIDPIKKDYYILVDTAFSHSGDIDYLKNQIKAAASGGADGIKFQILIDKDDAYSPNYEFYELFNKWMFIEKWKDKNKQ